MCLSAKSKMMGFHGLRISIYPQGWTIFITSPSKKPGLTWLCFPDAKQQTCVGKTFALMGEWKGESHQLPPTTWLPQASFQLCSKQTLRAGLYVKQILKSFPPLHSLPVFISTVTLLWTNTWKFRSPVDSHADITTLWTVSEALLSFKMFCLEE